MSAEITDYVDVYARAWCSPRCWRTACSNSERGNSFNSCEKILHTWLMAGPPRADWLMGLNPIPT